MGWERDLQGARQAAAVHEMVLEIDNIRTAWKWAINNLGLKLLMEGINGLCIFFDRYHQRLEGEAICHSLVERLDGIIVSNISGPCAQADAHSAHIDRLKLLARASGMGWIFQSEIGKFGSISPTAPKMPVYARKWRTG